MRAQLAIFQYLLVRLKDKARFRFKEKMVFQYLLVRLKATGMTGKQYERHISIPLGTIKSGKIYRYKS